MSNAASKKPRADATLKTLPEDQQQRLWDWCRDKTLAEVVTLAWQDLGVKTSATALGDWYSWYGLRLRMERREQRVGQIVDEIRRTDPHLSAEQLRAFGSSLFMSEALADGNADAFATAAGVDLKGKELSAKVEGFKAKYDQREREIALEREKFVLTKSRLKEQVADLQKNLGSPDAASRIAALVDAIDSL